MVYVAAISRRCMIVLGSSCNNDQQLRYANFFHHWYTHNCFQQNQRVANFCKSKKTTKKDSTKTTMRRVKKDQRTAVSDPTSAPTTMELKTLPASTNDAADKRLLDATTQSADVQFTSVYVHPLSQIVLNHLQTNCHEWIRSKCLDQNLALHRDGTFVLRSSKRTTTPFKMTTTVDHSMTRQNDTTTETYPDDSKREALSPKKYDKTNPTVKIWTTYDIEERKHWLCLSIDENMLQNKFLLQDNSLTPWQGFKLQSIPERIHACVFELIDAVNGYDNYPK
jgi:hypothetical protein